VTNSNGQIWRYEYDLADRLVREVDYDGRVLSYAYDVCGQLIKRVNGAGQVIELERDRLGQVVQRRSGSAVTTLSYDVQGRIVRAVNPDADVEFERDRLGRVVAETINGRTLAAGYDATGRRIARRTPSGVESRWQHDAAGRPVSLHIGGRTIEFEHDAAGREITRRFQQATLTQDWDPASRLVSQTVRGARSASPGDATQLLQERTYSYRADGFVTGIDDRLTGRRRYDLDRGGRVTAVTGTGWSERYAYDPAGNVLDAVRPEMLASGRGEHSTNGRREFTGSRVSRAGNRHYEFDAQGRITLRRQKLLSGGSRSWHYSWDAEDRLTAVTTPDGVHWRYRYDALGRRVAKQRLDADQRVVEQVDFCWDGVRLAEQSVTGPGGGTTTWDWEPEGFRPLVQLSAESVDERFYAIITDLIGTPTDFVTGTGEVLSTAGRSLWAALPPDSSCPLRFPGQYHDPETGFYYNVFRHYDPDTAQYSSADPLGLEPGVNARSYVSNPHLLCDPLGLAPYAGKPVNLPSWRKIGIDIEHIVSGHTAGGSRVSPLKDLFSPGMTRPQIANVVRQAYRHAGLAGPSQGERVFLAGVHDGVTYEMWVNKATKMIESAWPKY
jgi:RHS repeat-associated protein